MALHASVFVLIDCHWFRVNSPQHTAEMRATWATVQRAVWLRFQRGIVYVVRSMRD